ncbi:MAG: phosphoenolpyruvate mutase [Hyphomicrobiales bacterium]
MNVTPPLRPKRKTTRLKEMLAGPEMRFLMEAHNGLSAKVVEEAGFEGIWASGLSMSAALGVRDNNEASWTQVLEVCEFMADATSIPILLDGDTGYGNFNSARRLVNKLEQRGVAGVCIEDKLFPKTNSFIRGTAQPLADMEEHAGKIRAMKDAQSDDDFIVVARVEALIAGHGQAEAIKRGEAYRKAGADAVLIHSAQKNPAEILAFKREWGDRLPLVIVPTKYYTTPTEVFRAEGFRIVIWANHLMRAALAAMQSTARQIFAEQTLVSIEEKVAPISEVFRLQGEHELEQLEKAYLPKGGDRVRAIVLAAGQGKDLGNLVDAMPKTMLPVAGKPILAHIADAFRANAVRDLVVVRGFAKDAVNLPSLAYVDNDAFASTGELASLAKAAEHLSGPTIVCYGDVMFRRHVLADLLDVDADVVVAVDSLSAGENPTRRADWAVASHPHARTAFLEDVTLKAIAYDPATPGITGQWMGLVKFSEKGARTAKAIIEAMPADELRTATVPDLINRLLADGQTVRVAYSHNAWVDVNALADLVKGNAF